MKKKFRLNIYFDEENNIFEDLVENIIKEELIQNIKLHVSN